MVKQSQENKLLKIASIGLAAIFGLVVFHAPLSVFFGQYAPPLLVKSWKEIVLLVLLPLIAWAVLRSGTLARFSRDRLLRLILAYAALHLLLLFMFAATPSQALAGLAIDLRYLLFFVLVFCVASLQLGLRKFFLKAGAWSAAVSLSFAALQVFLLPPDFLKHIGYSKDTIAPFLTVDKNSDFIRINGTLRGPNPLGAYAMIILTLIMAFGMRSRGILVKYRKYLLIAAAMALAVLWASYSRSAVTALALSFGIVFFLRFGRRFRPVHLLVAIAALILIAGGIIFNKDSYFVQNVILHSNPAESESFNSNEGHAVSLQEGLKNFSQQPLGEGIGSTGSASLLGDRPHVVENQYLFVAHETGWLGFALFVGIFSLALIRLYKNRSDWLSLGAFASGAGLAVIGFIQPVFVDDTVSLIWWGVAAIALGASQQRKNNNAKKSH